MDYLSYLREFQATPYTMDGLRNSIERKQGIDDETVSVLDLSNIGDMDGIILGFVEENNNVATRVLTPDLSITSIESIKGFTMQDDLMFILDEIEDVNISNSQDLNYITGRGGRKLGSLKRNKSITVSGTNGLLSSGMIETQTGGRFGKGASVVRWTEYTTVKQNMAKINYKAYGMTGAEIVELYIHNPDGSAGTRFVQSPTLFAGKFTYNPSTGVISFPDGSIEQGTEIVVVYDRLVMAHTIANASDSFSEKLKLYVDATAEDRCSNVYRVQFFIPKADFSGNFDISIGDTQSVHAFEAESLASSCGLGSGTLWTYTVFGVNS